MATQKLVDYIAENPGNLFADTPADGETTKGISSNWAYDHAHDPDGHGNDLYPWIIFINPFHTPKSNINWSTIVIDINQIGGGYLDGSGAQNNEITWDVVLAAGTWTIEILCLISSNHGIASVQLDSVEKGTLDWYTATSVFNIRSRITGIIVPTTKKIELKLKMATKNPLSGGYYGRPSSICLLRTS